MGKGQGLDILYKIFVNARTECSLRFEKGSLQKLKIKLFTADATC